MEKVLFLLLIIILLYFFFTEKFNYETLHKNNKKYKKIIILYHVDWCGFCQKFIPNWIKLNNDNRLSDILFVDYNMTENKYFLKNNKDVVLDNDLIDKIKNVKISGFPTIKLYSNNNIINYTGSRDYEDIINFINNN